METPIGIGADTYTAANIATYSAGPVGGNPGSPSSITVSTNDFVPGDWVQFEITVTNTGSATLAVNNAGTYTITASIGGTLVYNLPSTSLNAGEFGQDSQAQSIAYLSSSALGPNSTPWDSSWFANNSWNPSNPPTGTMPAYLTTGQSFVWYLFIGLGDSAPYGISGFSTTITITLPSAN